MQVHTLLVYLTADPHHLLAYLNEKSASARIRYKKYPRVFSMAYIELGNLDCIAPGRSRIEFFKGWCLIFFSTLLTVLLGARLGTNI